MARTNLKPSIGLPIYFSNQELQSDEFNTSTVSVVDLEQVRPQLLNQELDCPDIFYNKYKDIDNSSEYFKKQNLRTNMYLMKSNLAGIEFVKSKATRCASYPRLFRNSIWGVKYTSNKNILDLMKNKIYRLTS